MIRILMFLVAFFWCSAAYAAEVTTQRDRPSNAEMRAMYEADQAAREVAEIDWRKLIADDEARRKRARAMLDAGMLQSGDDYFHAAFVFQHGSTANDILLAHVLAVTAVEKGRADASWIAAASLDRYLQYIGQPQVFGTQYQCRNTGPLMEPYDPGLLPDSIRTAAGVPARADQKKHGQMICGHAPGSVTKK